MCIKLVVILLNTLFLCFLILYVNGNPCVHRKYHDGYVCVCNDSYCDTLDNDQIRLTGDNGFVLVSSSKGGMRFNITHGTFENIRSEKLYSIGRHRKHFFSKFIDSNATPKSSPSFSPIRKAEECNIKVQRNITYQKIIGFGGALTGSVSYLLNKLSNNLQTFIYRSYYSAMEGIGYNLMRIPIGGCDFDLGPWAYNELPIDDVNLTNFTQLDERDLQKIKQINDLRQITNNNNIKFVGAAWSSPPWMKSNNEWTGRSFLKPKYYQTWADYHLKYLELMHNEGIDFWSISTGNEPLNGHYFALFVHFMSLGWTGETQGKWLLENLGPTIRESKFKNTQIMGSDDQRYIFPWWFEQMDKYNENSTKYLNGFGVHWYWDNIVPPSLLYKTHELYPDKFILNTESCIGVQPFNVHGPILGSWARAEQYILAYIQDLEHWVNGWIDWNIILDEQGGPNYVKNFVESPIIVNTTSFTEIYKQPLFYAIGHFSKFFTENSIRINIESSNKNVKTIGFERPDKSLAILIYNKSNRYSVINLTDELKGQISIQIPPKSLHTLIY